MRTRYRVFHEIQVWSGVWAMRPFDLRDRSRAGAIRLAAGLRNGEVRKKGSSVVEWAVLNAAERLRAVA